MQHLYKILRLDWKMLNGKRLQTTGVSCRSKRFVCEPFKEKKASCTNFCKRIIANMQLFATSHITNDTVVNLKN